MPRDLHFLVTLAGNQHNISRIRFADSQRNSGFAVRLGLVFCARALQSDHGVIDDGKWIFTAWVVRGQDYEIAAPSGGFPHQRTLGAVPIAATAENSDYLALLSRLLNKFPRQSG